jgi:hypothetical protein
MNRATEILELHSLLENEMSNRLAEALAKASGLDLKHYDTREKQIMGLLVRCGFSFDLATDTAEALWRRAEHGQSEVEFKQRCETVQASLLNDTVAYYLSTVDAALKCDDLALVRTYLAAIPDPVTKAFALDKIRQSGKSVPITRGNIRAYREFLNETYPADGGKSRGQINGRGPVRGRIKRAYGDYLYFQDREKFMVELQEWLLMGESASFEKAHRGRC